MDNNQHLTVSKTFDIIIQQLPNIYCYKKLVYLETLLLPKKKVQAERS